MVEKRVGLYLRVSTDEQTIENQRRELTAACEARGWHIVGEFKDEGVSGSKGRDARPGFDRLHKAVTRRSIDVVAAWAVDRLGRSLRHLVDFLAELDGVGCDLYLHQQALDTTTPAGRAMFGMCGVFAEFERSMIVERVNAGIARARENGTRSGRAIGRPKISPSQRGRHPSSAGAGRQGCSQARSRASRRWWHGPAHQTGDESRSRRRRSADVRCRG